MSDQSEPVTTEDRAALGDVAVPGDVDGDTVRKGEIVESDPSEAVPHESVQEPAKVMRVGSMIKQLLEEVRGLDLDEPARERLRDIYERSVSELSSALSPDLSEELGRLALPFDEAQTPSDAELRVAKAQLVGWLEGLFHGIQATLFSQQMVARQQLEEMRQQLNPGSRPGQPGPVPDRPGTYI